MTDEPGSWGENRGKPFRIDDEAHVRVTPISVYGGAPTRVSVVDFEIPFWSLVRLMVKFAFASIPAVIIIVLTVLFAAVILGGIFGIGLGLRG